MQKSVIDQNFILIENEPNFLFGISGNGLTTDLQQENISKNRLYKNFFQLNNANETSLLLDITNTILDYYNSGFIEQASGSMDVYKQYERLISKAKNGNDRLIFILDEFNRTFQYSSNFFYTLSLILTQGGKFLPIKFTSILIFDAFPNQEQEKLNAGLANFMFRFLNIQIIPPYSKDKINQIFNDRIKKSDFTLDEVYKQTAGNPSLTDTLIQSGKNSAEMEWKMNEIFDSLGTENQKILINIKKGKLVNYRHPLQKEFLEKTSIINKGKISMELMDEYISKLNSQTNGGNKNTIEIESIDVVLDTFPPQQEKLLLALYNAKGNIVDRDTIAKTLWGDEYLDKYSDYAIDQLIKKTRHKLISEYNLKNVIKTYKGKGYGLIN